MADIITTAEWQPLPPTLNWWFCHPYLFFFHYKTDQQVPGRVPWLSKTVLHLYFITWRRSKVICIFAGIFPFQALETTKQSANLPSLLSFACAQESLLLFFPSMFVAKSRRGPFLAEDMYAYVVLYNSLSQRSIVVRVPYFLRIRRAFFPRCILPCRSLEASRSKKNNSTSCLAMNSSKIDALDGRRIAENYQARNGLFAIGFVIFVRSFFSARLRQNIGKFAENCFGGYKLDVAKSRPKFCSSSRASFEAILGLCFGPGKCN